MSVHKKMTRSERAKQFVPFAALKGYSEALRRAEEEALRNYGEEDTERTAPDRTAPERTAPEWTAPERTASERTAPERMREDSQ